MTRSCLLPLVSVLTAIVSPGVPAASLRDYLSSLLLCLQHSSSSLEPSLSMSARKMLLRHVSYLITLLFENHPGPTDRREIQTPASLSVPCTLLPHPHVQVFLPAGLGSPTAAVALHVRRHILPHLCSGSL